MNLRAMTFETVGDGEDASAVPATITVKMSRAEALYIAASFGGRNGGDAEAVMPGGAEVNHSIYDCLVSDVFNRYWGFAQKPTPAQKVVILHEKSGGDR